jgi:hypothetical protein
VLLTLVHVSAAATVAVLDFDAYGVAHEDAAFVAEQVRDALLAGGALDPVSATDLASAVTRDHEDALRRAREAFTDGRVRWSAGDASGAASAFQGAVGLHFEARSDLARRAELADAGWMLAVALDAAGDVDGARGALATLSSVYPGYAAARAPVRPTSVVTLFAEAEMVRLRAQPRRWAETAVAELEASLAVDLIVTGALRSDGRVSVRVYDEGVVIGETSAMLTASPPALFDPAYEAVAAALVAAASGGGVEEPQGEPEAGGPRGASAVAVEDPADAAGRLSREDDDRADAEPRRSEPRPSATGAVEPRRSEPRPSATGAAEPRRSEPRPSATRASHRVSATSVRVTPAPRPVNERWWFWALLLTATSGAGAAVGAWMYEPRPVVQAVPDTWALRVATP